MTKGKSFYPVFLDLGGRRCTVFGGGKVALRKISSLLECGALVRVISPRLDEEIRALGDLEILEREYRVGDLEGTFLAVAATDSEETNRAVAAEAEGRGVLINVVDVPGLCNFIVPASVRRGEMVIAVSTGGESPALARKLRETLEKEFGEEYGTLAGIIGEVRRELKRRGKVFTGDTWQESLDLETLAGLVRNGEIGKAKETLVNLLTGNGVTS